MKNLTLISKRTAGISLVETLVVGSFMSILAIVAMPNLLEAQTRARVAAAKNNMRNLATKFELVQVDTSSYPLAGKWRQILHWRAPEWIESDTSEDKFKTGYKLLYGKYEDPFEQEALKRLGVYSPNWLAVNADGQHLAHGFNFFNPQLMIEAIENGSVWQGQDRRNWEVLSEHAGSWLIYSSGPDLIANSPQTIDEPSWGHGYTGDKNYVEKMLFHEYDPTNGTISYGNLFRTQRNTAGLGAHPHFYK